MRFPMRIDPMFRPVAMLFGASSERSFVDIDERDVRFRYGFFDETVPREEILGVGDYRPQWYTGLGWRWIPGHAMLLGSHHGVVSFELSRSRRVRLFPLAPRFASVRRISVSVDEPTELVASLTQRGM